MAELKTIEYTPMQALIRLVTAGARKECVNELQVDWDAVLPLLVEQKVTALVACALLYSPKLNCPENLRESLMSIMRNEASINLVRQQRIVQLLGEMREEGIQAKILKGYAVARCYAHPECRGSVDTDLLIDIRQEKQTISYFENLGFRIDPRAATSHHTVCRHKKYGMVELHVSLYEELVQDIWLQEFQEGELVQEDAIIIDELGGCISTLGHNDLLIFLTLHMVKHFILSGLTLKMMIDIALCFATYRDSIDAVRYWSTLEKLHYDKLVSGIIWSVIRFGGFQADEFPGSPNEDPQKTKLILTDIEKGGYMGVKEKDERLESGMEYNRQLMRKQQSVLQYKLRMLMHKVKSGEKYMFPSMEMLHRIYPVTKKAPIVAPLFWLGHMVSFPIKKIRLGVLERDVRSENCQMSRVAENRLRMFKDLEML